MKRMLLLSMSLAALYVSAPQYSVAAEPDSECSTGCRVTPPESAHQQAKSDDVICSVSCHYCYKDKETDIFGNCHEFPESGGGGE